MSTNKRSLRYFKRKLTYIERASFLFANLIIFALYCVILSINSVIEAITIFVIGLLLSAILVKTKWFLSKSANEFESEKVWEWVFESGKRDKFLAYLRLSFFNILNDLFLILIVWVGYIGLISLLGFVHFDYSITEYVSVISAIGILAGLFQFYLRYYREKISDEVLKSFTQTFKNIFSKISYFDFLNYINHKNSTLYEKINAKKRKNAIGGFPILMRLERSKKIAVAFPYKPDEDSEIKITEMALEELDKKDKALYIELCESYFKEKVEEIKNDIEKLDFTELRNAILGNLYLFEEIESMVTRVENELPERKEKPESFTDCWVEAFEEVLSHMSKFGGARNA